MKRTYILTGILGLLFVPYAFSQVDDGDIEMSRDCQESVLELVERYEEMRVLLREQIDINTSLYSEDEMEAMTADLRSQIEDLHAALTEMTQRYKEAQISVKVAEEQSLAFKNQLLKERGDLSDEIETLQVLAAGIEEERLLTTGLGFSQDGYVSSLAMFNLPGTNLSGYGEINYAFRSQEYFVNMGVAFQLFPQRRLVEGWERLRRRIVNRRSRAKAESLEQSDEGSIGSVLTDALEREEDSAETEIPEESRRNRSTGAVEDTVPVIP